MAFLYVFLHVSPWSKLQNHKILVGKFVPPKCSDWSGKRKAILGLMINALYIGDSHPASRIPSHQQASCRIDRTRPPSAKQYGNRKHIGPAFRGAVRRCMPPLALALDGRCGPDKSHKVDGVQLTQPAMSNKLT